MAGAGRARRTVPPRGSSIGAAVVVAVHDRLDAGAGRVGARVDVRDQADRRARRRAASRSRSRCSSSAASVEADRLQLVDEQPRQVELARRARALRAVARRTGCRCGRSAGSARARPAASDSARVEVKVTLWTVSTAPLARWYGEPCSIAPAPPVPVVTVDRPTQVSAYGSGVLFSKRDPASGPLQALVHGDRPPARAAAGRRPRRAVRRRPRPRRARALPRRLLALRARAALGPGRRGRAAELLARPRLRPLRARPDDRARAPAARVLDDRRRGAARGLEGRAGVRARVHVEARSSSTHRTGGAARGGCRAGRRRAPERRSTSTGAGWRSAGSTRAATTARPRTCGMDDVVTGPRAADRPLPRRRADDDLAAPRPPSRAASSTTRGSARATRAAARAAPG